MTSDRTCKRCGGALPPHVTPDQAFAHLQHALSVSQQKVVTGELMFAYGKLAGAVQWALAQYHAVCNDCMENEWPIRFEHQREDHHGS